MSQSITEFEDRVNRSLLRAFKVPLGVIAMTATAEGGLLQPAYRLVPTNPTRGTGQLAINSGQILIGWYGSSSESVTGIAQLIDVATGDTLAELRDPIGQPSDGFGSVALSPEYAVVGASSRRMNAERSGDVMVFDASSGELLHSLDTPTPQANARFGWSVAIDDDLLVVGAPFRDNGTRDSGAAYLYSAVTGALIFELSPEGLDVSVFFGGSVAIQGDSIIVGAYGDDDGGLNAGAAYVFDATTGRQRYKLVANDATPNALFGHAVSIDGSTALIGAQGDSQRGVAAGAAYFFDLQTGHQLKRLTGSRTDELDVFGTSVSLSGNLALVGAARTDIGGSRTGSVYLFDSRSGDELDIIIRPDALTRDYFGIDVAINDSYAVVGSYPGFDSQREEGSVHVYRIVLEPSGLSMLTIASALIAAVRQSSSPQLTGMLAAVTCRMLACGADGHAEDKLCRVRCGGAESPGDTAGFVQQCRSGCPASTAGQWHLNPRRSAQPRQLLSHSEADAGRRRRIRAQINRETGLVRQHAVGQKHHQGTTKPGRVARHARHSQLRSAHQSLPPPPMER